MERVQILTIVCRNLKTSVSALAENFYPQIPRTCREGKYPFFTPTTRFMPEAFATEGRLTKESPHICLHFYIAWSFPREMKALNLCIHVGVEVFACWGTCVWRPQDSLKCVVPHKPNNLMFWNRIPHRPGACQLGQPSDPGVCLPLPSQSWDGCKHTPLHDQIFNMDSEFWAQVFVFTWQGLYKLSHLPSSNLYIFVPKFHQEWRDMETWRRLWFNGCVCEEDDDVLSDSWNRCLHRWYFPLHIGLSSAHLLRGEQRGREKISSELSAPVCFVSFWFSYVNLPYCEYRAGTSAWELCDLLGANREGVGRSDPLSIINLDTQLSYCG